MKSLWQKRFFAHVKEQGKFLRLVFNEYFILAIIFIIGAVGFWYSQALELLPNNTWWTRPVAILVLIIIGLLFRPATLLQQADVAFLLPQEKALPKYLRLAHNYSLILPSITVALTGFFLTPFLARGASFSPIQVVLITLTAIFLAIAGINFQLANFYQATQTNYLKIIISLGLLVLSAYGQAIVALFLALIWFLWSEYQWRKLSMQAVFQWLVAIKSEDNRAYRLKRFYNLFTDVPGMSSKIARRSWLDWTLKPIKPQHNNTYLYLFARGFIRNTEYSGLFTRLTIVVLLLIYAIHSYLLISIIAALFLYLVEFQLLPLYKSYDAIVLTQIYPLTNTQKQHSFQLFIIIILLFQWLVMSLLLLICNNLSIKLLAPIGVSGLMVILLTYVFLPRQLQKLNHR